MNYSTQIRWIDLDEPTKYLAAAAYGQHFINKLVVELNIIDTRFDEDNSLPWDAYGEVEDGKLKLIGMTGPSGFGPAKEVVLPEDVLIEFEFWIRS